MKDKIDESRWEDLREVTYYCIVDDNTSLAVVLFDGIERDALLRTSASGVVLDKEQILDLITQLAYIGGFIDD